MSDGVAWVLRGRRASARRSTLLPPHPHSAQQPTGLPELMVAGLPYDEARALLSAALPGRMDEGVLGRLVARPAVTLWPTTAPAATPRCAIRTG